MRFITGKQGWRLNKHEISTEGSAKLNDFLNKEKVWNELQRIFTLKLGPLSIEKKCTQHNKDDVS